MKASSLVDIGQEGEGDRVDNKERNPQVIGIQVQGLLVTWNKRFMAFRIGIRHFELFELKHLRVFDKPVKLLQLQRN